MKTKKKKTTLAAGACGALQKRKIATVELRSSQGGDSGSIAAKRPRPVQVNDFLV